MHKNQFTYIICLLFLSLLMQNSAICQSDILLTQYYQNLPIVAPGLAGAVDFLDIRTSYRQQWAGFEGAPRTIMFGANGIKKFKNNHYKYNSARVSNLAPYEENGVKVGLGGYIIDDELGAFNQFAGMINTAVHVPIKNRTYLSLGLSYGINYAGVDIDKVTVLDQDDVRYQDFLNHGSSSYYLRINGGLSLYAPQYYLSYSILNAGDILLSGFKSQEKLFAKYTHIVLGGYRFSLNPDFELISSALFRLSANKPMLFDLGLKLRYRQFADFGMAYRNDQSMIGMIGFLIDDKYRFGYSYEYKFLDLESFNASSHEVVLGIQLFNKKRYVPIW